MLIKYILNVTTNINHTYKLKTIRSYQQINH